MALILRNGGSQNPDRWLKEPRNNQANNPVGLDATVAWYGFGFILYAVFDLVFFPTFYKSGYKVGKSFIFAAIPMVFLMIAIEVTAHIPIFVWMDSHQPEHLLIQLPILIVGIVCYGVLVPLAYQISAKRFEKVDL